jgi:hypothetical protein
MTDKAEQTTAQDAVNAEAEALNERTAAASITDDEALGGIAPIEYKKAHEVEAAKLMYGASYKRLRERGHIVVPSEAEEKPSGKKSAKKTTKRASARKRSK